MSPQGGEEKVRPAVFYQILLYDDAVVGKLSLLLRHHNLLSDEEPGSFRALG